jgi:hypothetical protein
MSQSILDNIMLLPVVVFDQLLYQTIHVSSMVATRPNKRKSAAASQIPALPRLVFKKQRQAAAFDHLLKLRTESIGRSGGNCVNKDIDLVVKSCNDPYVTRDSMNYLLRKQKKANMAVAAPIVAAAVEPPMVAAAESRDTASTTFTTPGMTNYSQVVEPPHTEKPIITATMTMAEKTRLATTYATTLFRQLKDESFTAGTNVSSGKLDSIIKKVEKEFMLESGTVKKSTIRSRIQVNNHTGVNKCNISPLHDLEHYLACVIIENARQSNTWRKDDIMRLARSACKGTIHARLYNDRMKNQRPPGPIQAEVANVGDGWFQGFQKRQERILKRGSRYTG